MNRTFTLILLLFFFTAVLPKKIFAFNYNNFGDATPYTLNASDSLTIVSGTYTGVINDFPPGSRITVLSGATFMPDPSSFPFPEARGILRVYGTFTFNNNFRSNTSFTLHNYGNTRIIGTTRLSGQNQLWTNYFGAVLTFGNDVEINCTVGGINGIVNDGVINFQTNFRMNAGATLSYLTNRNVITIAGNYTNSGGVLNNFGKFEVNGSVLFNNGQATINNYCRMLVDRGITNTSGYISNYSYMWARSTYGLGNITNSGIIYNAPIARIHGVNFTISSGGSVIGAGYLYFPGHTVMTGGVMGVPGVTTDTIRFYDVTRTNPSTIFDVQSGGTRHPNFVYRVFRAPDSLMELIPGCVLPIEIPLTTQWNYFYVNLSNNIPSLNWSTQHEAGTSFAIERSYDNINFSLLDIIPALANKNAYSYNDATVNAMNGIAYYRIKAIEPTGAPRLSVVRSVKFSAKSGMIVQATPNPFTSQFNLNYQSQRSEKIAVEVFNMAGQLQFSKTIAVANGFNVIGLPESQRLDKGLYLVRVSNETGLLSSEKVIRQ